MKTSKLYNRFYTIYNIIFFFLCFIVSSLIFMPFPSMPKHNLDPSWIFSMNEAAVRKFIFGQDIIFTYGPYANIYTHFYDPENIYSLVIGSLYMTCSFCYALFLNFKNSNLFIKLILVTIIFLFPNRESAFLLFPLLSFNYIYNNFEITKCNTINIVIMLLPLGLLPLVKGTFLLISFIVIFILFLSFMIKDSKKYLNYLIVIFVPALFCCLLWVLSGQYLQNLLLYFISSVPIISGYTEAMNGFFLKPIYMYIYVIFALIILYEVYQTTKDKYILFIYFLSLFLAFKEGFVIYDGHVIVAYTFIIFVSMVLLAKEYKNIVVILSFFVITFIFLDLNTYYLHTNKLKNTNDFIEYTHTYVLKPSLNRYRRLINDAIVIFSLDFTPWEEKRLHSIQSIQKSYPIPLLPGTSDIYSYNQTDLLVSGNIWNPRPIFQSYSAYTESLLEVNKKHLLQKNRPDNIFFRLETYGGRYPSLDDGLSWPTIADNYKLVNINDDLAILRKKDEILYESNMRNIEKTAYKFKDEVKLPETDMPLFAKIHIQPTLFGRISNIFFRGPFVAINITCKNGKTYQMRIVPKMAASGFFLSPFVQNTLEFAELISGNHQLLSDNQVVTMSIEARRRFYKKVYTLELSEFYYSGEPAPARSFLHTTYKNIKDAQVKSVNCIGKIDNIHKNALGVKIDGWILHKYNNEYMSVEDVFGLYKEQDILHATSFFVRDYAGIRQIFNAKNDDGNIRFGGFIPERNEYFIGYKYNNELYQCNNIKIKSP